MTKPVPPLSQIPQLNDVVKINDSLRPAVLPWNPKLLVNDALIAGYPIQDALAEEVIERVQNRIAELMPELVRDAVEQVLLEHTQKPEK
mgnify:CR=1 FL=1|jgi:hypothetical protein